jgi:hypothetical protein
LSSIGPLHGPQVTSSNLDAEVCAARPGAGMMAFDEIETGTEVVDFI